MPTPNTHTPKDIQFQPEQAKIIVSSEDYSLIWYALAARRTEIRQMLEGRAICQTTAEQLLGDNYRLQDRLTLS